MLTIVLALFFGTFSGTVAGGLLNWWLLHQNEQATQSVQVPPLDRDVDSQIEQVASQWPSQDQPEIAALVADKRRLAYALSQRRGRRSDWRWSK
jgi:Na+/glutamate symporter